MEERYPRLNPDDLSGCPCSMESILDYLQVESASMSRPILTFLRTADVEGTRFWLWRFDDDGREAYVVCSEFGGTSLLSTDPARQSSEDYMKRIDERCWA